MEISELHEIEENLISFEIAELFETEEKNKLKDAISNLKQINEFNYEQLDRTDLLAAKFTVGPCAKYARIASIAFKAFTPNNLQYLHPSVLRVVNDCMTNFLSNIVALSAISATDANAVVNLNNIRHNLKTAFHTYSSQISGAISAVHTFDVINDSNTKIIAKSIEEIKVIKNSMTQQLELSKNESESLKSEIESSFNSMKASAEVSLQEIKSKAADAAIIGQANHFEKEADAAKESSNKWLIAMIVTSIILALLPLVFVFTTKFYAFTPTNNYEIIQFWTSKMLLFAVVAYFLFQCVRSWNAHRHNYVVNRHRYNALQTFTSLAAAASEEGKRDIILSHAAACIFAPQETGFSKNNASAPPGSQLVEILPKLAGSSTH